LTVIIRNGIRETPPCPEQLGIIRIQLHNSLDAPSRQPLGVTREQPLTVDAVFDLIDQGRRMFDD